MTPDAIRALRKKLSASQRKFANLMGVSIRLVQGWESGETVPAPAHDKLLQQCALVMTSARSRKAEAAR